MFYLGIDIGGTNIKIGLISKDYEIIKWKKFPTPNDLIKVLIDEIQEFVNENPISAIGVGVAGIVSKEGTVIESPNIPSLNKVPLASILQDRFLTETVVENDATVATIGEANFGEGRGFSRFILLTLGTGIGGGFYYNGRILDIPMEVGHMTVNYQGKLCSCGNLGCLEVYASGRAIKESLIEKIENGESSQASSLYKGSIYKITPEDVYNLALEGDNLARQILKEAGKCLGAAMASLINIFAPEKIILTGGLSKAKNIYLETAINEAKKRSLEGLSSGISIVQSNLIDVGGLLGAIFTARNK